MTAPSSEEAMGRDFNPETPVRQAIAGLLAVVLPPRRHAWIPALVDDICQSYYAAPYVSKVWGALSEGEKNVVARAVGLAARDAADILQSLQSRMDQSVPRTASRRFAMDVEGNIAKRLASRYRAGPCSEWQKIKNPAYSRPEALRWQGSRQPASAFNE